MNGQCPRKVAKSPILARYEQAVMENSSTTTGPRAIASPLLPSASNLVAISIEGASAAEGPGSANEGDELIDAHLDHDALQGSKRQYADESVIRGRILSRCEG